jgi:peptidoglycan/xylan/chitin deacetylase (PgdA/CDA1 family)
MSVPFEERGGPLRGCLDLACGRFPAFLFGGGLGNLLPAFHFHDVTREELEPKLRYLAENGYRTVTADGMARHARGAGPQGDRLVALCFDDAWASLWTVALPLFQQYGLTAVTYAIPSRIEDAERCRPPGDRSGPRFVTWPELRALTASGLVDVQSHSDTHSMVFCGPEVTGFVTPEYQHVPFLNRPQLATVPALRFVDAADLGAPLYPARSRMSNARRVHVPLEAHTACVAHVSARGGAAFFTQSGWEAEVVALARKHSTTTPATESPAERMRAIEAELDRSRAVLAERLGTNTVRHVCLPWGIASQDTIDTVRRLGYQSAVANRLRGVHAIRPGDDPFWLKRLPNRHILALPGRGRRFWA